MFAAGFSSAITAPLASSITAQSLFGSQNEKKWSHTSRNYRIIWMIVLVTGLVFGFSKVQPVPAIILAQALNGLVLPFISIFLVFVINNPTLMRDGTLNKHWNNVLMGLVVWVSLNLGLFNVLKAVYKTLGWGASFDTYWWVIIALASSLISIWVWVEAYKLRKHLPHKQ
jgi:Mn2+/Fe2+ NRAMP family transporter